MNQGYTVASQSYRCIVKSSSYKDFMTMARASVPIFALIGLYHSLVGLYEHLKPRPSRKTNDNGKTVIKYEYDPMVIKPILLEKVKGIFKIFPQRSEFSKYVCPNSKTFMFCPVICSWDNDKRVSLSSLLELTNEDGALYVEIKSKKVPIVITNLNADCNLGHGFLALIERKLKHIKTVDFLMTFDERESLNSCMELISELKDSYFFYDTKKIDKELQELTKTVKSCADQIFTSISKAFDRISDDSYVFDSTHVHFFQQIANYT